MLKQIICLRRQPWLSRDEFQAHWLGPHARLGFTLRNLRRYVQYHAVSTVGEPRLAELTEEEPLDGVAISWWDDFASMQEQATDDALAVAQRDLDTFVDQTRSFSLFVEEDVVVQPAATGDFVLFKLLRRRDDVEGDSFRKAWTAHEEIVKHSDFRDHVVGYIRNYPKSLSEASASVGDVAGSLDGVGMIYGPSIAAFKALARAGEPTGIALNEAGEAVEQSRSLHMLGARRLILDLVR